MNQSGSETCLCRAARYFDNSFAMGYSFAKQGGTEVARGWFMQGLQRVFLFMFDLVGAYSVLRSPRPMYVYLL